MKTFMAALLTVSALADAPRFLEDEQENVITNVIHAVPIDSNPRKRIPGLMASSIIVKTTVEDDLAAELGMHGHKELLSMGMWFALFDGDWQTNNWLSVYFTIPDPENPGNY